MSIFTDNLPVSTSKFSPEEVKEMSEKTTTFLLQAMINPDTAPGRYIPASNFPQSWEFFSFLPVTKSDIMVTVVLRLPEGLRKVPTLKKPPKKMLGFRGMYSPVREWNQEIRETMDKYTDDNPMFHNTDGVTLWELCDDGSTEVSITLRLVNQEMHELSDEKFLDYLYHPVNSMAQAVNEFTQKNSKNSTEVYLLNPANPSIG